MPSHRIMEQAMTWLRSKAAEADIMDKINAELCIHVIEDLKRQRDALGAKFQIANGDRKMTQNYGHQLEFTLDSPEKHRLI